jgi:hypothetical protein
MRNDVSPTITQPIAQLVRPDQLASSPDGAD